MLRLYTSALGKAARNSIAHDGRRIDSSALTGLGVSSYDKVSGIAVFVILDYRGDYLLEVGMIARILKTAQFADTSFINVGIKGLRIFIIIHLTTLTLVVVGNGEMMAACILAVYDV